MDKRNVIKENEPLPFVNQTKMELETCSPPLVVVDWMIKLENAELGQTCN